MPLHFVSLSSSRSSNVQNKRGAHRVTFQFELTDAMYETMISAANDIYSLCLMICPNGQLTSSQELLIPFNQTVDFICGDMLCSTLDVESGQLHVDRHFFLLQPGALRSSSQEPTTMKSLIPINCLDVFGVHPGDVECNICMSDAKTAILMPCRHNCCCSQCLRSLHRCPVCRAAILESITFTRALA